MNASAKHRSRVLRRLPESARRLSGMERSRGRIRAALDRCGEHERMVLAILLLERLTPEEAAGVLGVPTRQVVTTFRAVMAELARAARGPSAPPPRAALAEPRLRRA